MAEPITSIHDPRARRSLARTAERARARVESERKTMDQPQKIENTDPDSSYAGTLHTRVSVGLDVTDEIPMTTHALARLLLEIDDTALAAPTITDERD